MLVRPARPARSASSASSASAGERSFPARPRFLLLLASLFAVSCAPSGGPNLTAHTPLLAPPTGLSARFDPDGVVFFVGDDSISVVARAATLAGGARTLSGPHPAASPLMPSAARASAAQASAARAATSGADWLEYPDRGEFWAIIADSSPDSSGSAAFEQVWVVDSGASEVVSIPVDISGADASVATDGRSVSLLGESGAVVLVSGLAAWDADGRSLLATFSGLPLRHQGEDSSSAFTVRVDVRGATYPITIDPLYSTASTTLDGSSAADELGSAVSGAGDLDGDGYADVLLGAPGHAGGQGLVATWMGSPAGPVAGSSVVGEAASDLFGASVSGAGPVGSAVSDIDGDSDPDVLIGSPGYDSDRGRVYAWSGGSGGLVATASYTVDGEVAGDQFGYSAAVAGDLDGDGLADAAVGAWAYGGEAGRAYVYPGSGAFGSSTTLDGEAAGDGFSKAMAGAGDVNGDGYEDLAVAAEGYQSDTGRVYVYAGSSSGIGTTALSTVTGRDSTSYPGEAIGRSVSGAGDVDGDGFSDLIIGGEGAKAAVYTGSASGLGTSAATSLTSGTSSDRFGYAVSAAGDVDADGYDDIVVGAERQSASLGTTWLYIGSASGVSSTATSAVYGESASSLFGTAVGRAGDVNGDGYDDVVVGAPGYGTAGRAYLHEGYSAVDADGDGVDQSDDCDDADPSVGGVDSRYVDGDGDGYGGDVGDACADASGYVDVGGDCDDTDASINPAATEICDAGSTDEDCDGLTDDSDTSTDTSSLNTWYDDADHDGSGGATTKLQCDQPANSYATSDDCDDSNSGIHPGAIEVCDPSDVDEDCDGLSDDADDSVSTARMRSFYPDADGDGDGTSAGLVKACDAPAGHGTTDGDCDDADATIYTGAPEVCDLADNDCDGFVDDGVSSTFYADADGDTYGDRRSAAAGCGDPAEGQSLDDSDCDDTDAAINPAAVEVCDGIDQDCDSVVDNGVLTTWHLDFDNDTFGDASTTTEACAAPESFVEDGTDCDDHDASSFPGASETCGDSVDQDCDGGDTVCDTAVDTDTGGDTDTSDTDTGDTDTADTTDTSDTDDQGGGPKAVSSGCGCAAGTAPGSETGWGLAGVFGLGLLGRRRRS